MKAVILYHPQSEHRQDVEQFARDFERFHNQKVELLSLETKDGDDIAKLYGVTSYPTVIASRDSGEMLQMWSGEHLPLMDELAAYLSS